MKNISKTQSIDIIRKERIALSDGQYSVKPNLFAIKINGDVPASHRMIAVERGPVNDHFRSISAPLPKKNKSNKQQEMISQKENPTPKKHRNNKKHNYAQHS